MDLDSELRALLAKIAEVRDAGKQREALQMMKRAEALFTRFRHLQVQDSRIRRGK